ncbi:MAG: hypothetical protein LBT68_06110 [Spirochaetales bacterium]|jgi:hypothetical protein|nr:hypothetical protein [Spirochaetales bacterium]
MNKRIPRAARGLLFFLCVFLSGLPALHAQSALDTDIPIVIAGVLHALEYAEGGEDESGATVDGSLSWTFSSDGENLRLTFSDYRYSFFFYGGENSATLNGTLTIDDFMMNGTLSTNGLSFSSVQFNNLDAYQNTEKGGITIDGVFYSQSEITKIIGGAENFGLDTDNVITWERECLFAGFMPFLAGAQLEWADGESVLDSLGQNESPQHEGERLANKEKTLSAVLRDANTVEFTYNNYKVEFPISFTVTGNLRVGMSLQEDGEVQSISFDGSAVFKGLASVSSMEITNCVITESLLEEQNIPGDILINGKSYRARDFLPALTRQF